jgi:hypothetical protein
MYIIVFLGIMFLVSLLSAVARKLFAKFKDEHNRHQWEHAVDEVEIDAAALLTSFMVTQCLRTTLVGKYPQLHLQLNLAQSGPHGVVHTQWQKNFMIVYAIILTLFTAVILPKLGVKVSHSASPTVRKMHDFLRMTLVMMAAWGFLLWSEWQFTEGSFKDDRLFGNMVFAMGCTFFCLFLIHVAGTTLDSMPVNDPSLTEDQRQFRIELRQTAHLFTVGFSLCTAWAWEHSFSMALDVFAWKFQVGYGGLVPKIAVAVLMPILIIPVYVNFLKAEVKHDAW